MTNFDFLKEDGQFAIFSDACIEAERSIAASPALCALGVRKSAELTVKWLYSVDRSLKVPYKDNFSALVYNPDFVDSVDQDIMDRLRYIIKLGNFAAHTNRQVTYKEAVLSLYHLFGFIQFVDYCYGSNYQERRFDEKLLAADTNQSVSNTEYEKVKSELDARDEERKELLKEMEKLRDQMESLRKQNEQTRTFKTENQKEADTRRTIIDIDIKAMGWVFGRNCIEEVDVIGMPNKSGTGKVDYVLYDDDGKPLAVVEAKRTLVDPKEGKEQAVIYADCLEKMTEQRPLIFYTNGYNTWFWDDLRYTERKVYSVFSKQDLQRIMSRRKTAKPLEHININEKITNRNYQKIAIQMVCKDFNECRRKALLVMATGTGKTRTAISIVDVLMDMGWVTNFLMLADRTELVGQAMEAFRDNMKNLTTCNLSERRDDKPTARGIFSTYPTIMNAINVEKTDDGEKLFTPAHFDLIIIDEAHRSIFKKYRAIFEYFDALTVGLTATPKTDVDHNTYDFFDLEDNMPTYAYEYDEAIHHEPPYLVDYHCMEKLFKVPTQGFHYDDLSKEEQEILDDVFEEDGEKAPDFVSGSSIDTTYFNINTTNRIISEVMEKGLKVEGGDKLGKTIIFAKNHKHALFIEKQFNTLYPKYKGKFARVIDNKVKHHKKLLKDFKKADSYPQIAISVDMLDTGIDVPEILNLVFYKQVFSASKFWQMFGRGTRLCKDLFGPGQDKTEFYIFDYLGNFEFFRQNKKGKEAGVAPSLTERMFELKVNIIRVLQAMRFQTEELIPFRKSLVDDVVGSIQALNRELFQVRQQLQTIDKYSDENAFEALDLVESENMIARIGNLIPPLPDDEYAKRLDVLMYQMELAKAEDDDTTYDRLRKKVQGIAYTLVTYKATLTEVQKAKDMLAKIQKDGFWETTTITEIDQIRQELRLMMYCLVTQIKTKVIDVTDEVIFEQEGERLDHESVLDSYYERAERYVNENLSNPVLFKLRSNMKLTDDDWKELEHIFWHEVGTEEEYKKATENVPLGKFVRSITGLTAEAADAAFGEFLDRQVYSEAQVHFVQCIVDYVVQWGTIDMKEMGDPSFSGGYSVVEVFGDNLGVFNRIKSVINMLNSNAERMAA